MAVDNDDWLIVKLRCAVNELMLVLMVAVILITPVKVTHSGDMPISTPALLLAAMTGVPP
jgi:hypothetical protein